MSSSPSRVGLLTVSLGLVACEGNLPVTHPDPCPPPRVQAAIVRGDVTTSVGTPVPEAPVLLTVAQVGSPNDTTGACSAFEEFALSTIADSAGRYREKIRVVHGSFLCVSASTTVDGVTAMSGLAKLELRLDLGPACTPEESFDAADLKLVLP